MKILCQHLMRFCSSTSSQVVLKRQEKAKQQRISLRSPSSCSSSEIQYFIYSCSIIRIINIYNNTKVNTLREFHDLFVGVFVGVFALLGLL